VNQCSSAARHDEGGPIPQRSAALTPQVQLAHLDRTLLALADPARRGVVELLRQRPRRAGELAQALSMTPPALSRHLRLLRKTGLVAESELEHDARVRVYRLEAAPFVELRSWLEQVEAAWSDQLSAFKAHVEASDVRAGRAQQGLGTVSDGAAKQQRGNARPKVGRAGVGRRATPGKK
jgi:DNA-binding transcriptional ArsR family regulator